MSSKRIDIPFYALPSRRKSSAEIIREAKADIKIMAAQRPSTPFARSMSVTENIVNDSRPSSSTSHVSYLTESPQSRPLSSIRLKPLRAKSAGHREPIENLRLEPTVIKTPLIDRRTGCKVLQGPSSSTISFVPASGDGKMSSAEIVHESLFSADITKSSTVDKKIHIVDGKVDKTSEVSPTEETKFGKSKSVNIGILIGVQDASRDSTDENSQKLENFEKEVKKYIPQLEKLLTAGKQKNELQGLEVISKLFQLFEDSDMFTASFPSRFTLLKALYRLLNSSYPTLSLHVSKLVLEMKVTEKNLSNVCKLLYKICHEERNIVEFLACGILGPFVDSVKNVAPQENPQALKYGISLICLLSTKDLLLDVLGVFKCHEVLLQHLNRLNSIEDSNRNEENSYITIKIVTALRYLSENKSVLHSILYNGTCKQLMKTLVLNEENVQIVITTVRLLSMIANSSEGCNAISACDNSCNILANLVIYHKSQVFIILQLTFIVGNLISHDSEIALEFYALPGFLNTLHFLLDEFILSQVKRAKQKESFCKNQLLSSGDKIDDKSDVDLMMKVVRILANMCVCSDIGQLLSEEGRFIICLLEIINVYKVEDPHDVFEPLVSVLITLNNITYFMNSNSEIAPRIAETIVPLLSSTYVPDIQLEACNVFQNLTRLPQVRAFIFKNKLIPAFVSLFEEYQHEVAVSGYAIMMNILLDKAARGPFYKEQGVTKLLHKLHLCIGRDWKTAALLCQILWNYCSLKDEDEDDSKKPLTQLEIKHLIKVLQYSTGTSTVLENDEEGTKQDWESLFCPIGNKLLELLHSFM